MAEKDDSDNLKVSYTNGLNEVISRTDYSGETPNTVFFLYDANCNVNAIVNEDGELVKTFDYEEFGGSHPYVEGAQETYDSNNQNAADNQMLFAGGVGHPTDDSGLVYMRARYYDPASGRFISEDPAGREPNPYAYCRSNPANAVDPDGRETVTIDDIINAILYTVAQMNDVGMIGLYLSACSRALLRLGHAMEAWGMEMKNDGQLFEAEWLETRGGVLAGNGALLTIIADFMEGAAILCDLEDVGAFEDYLTSAQSVGSL